METSDIKIEKCGRDAQRRSWTRQDYNRAKDHSHTNIVLRNKSIAAWDSFLKNFICCFDNSWRLHEVLAKRIQMAAKFLNLKFNGFANGGQWFFVDKVLLFPFLRIFEFSRPLKKYFWGLQTLFLYVCTWIVFSVILNCE